MLNRIKTWAKKLGSHPKYDAGLWKIQEATRKKMELAAKLNDRRKHDCPVKEDRRLSNGQTKERWLAYARAHS